MHDAYKYIEPSDDIVSIIPSISKLHTDLKKLHEGLGCMFVLSFVNDNFTESEDELNY